MIRPATSADVPTIAQFILDLAEYERLGDSLTLNETRLHDHLFGPRPYIEALIAEERDSTSDSVQPVGFALFFFDLHFLTTGGASGWELVCSRMWLSGESSGYPTT